MKIIKSKDNPTYKLAIKLTKKKFRDKMGMYLLEGVKPLEDALSEGIKIEQIFVADGNEIKRFPEAITSILDNKLFEELTDTKTSQGVIAVVEQQPSDNSRIEQIIDNSGKLIVLDRIQDPGNMGTIIRTAEAAGFAGVILTKGCVDPYSSKVVRAAAGSLFRIPIITKVEEEKLISRIQKINKALVVTALEGAIDYSEADLNKDIAIVIGNEGQGVSERFINAADLKIKIPMAGGIESLNAAVAAGILMYESQKIY